MTGPAASEQPRILELLPYYERTTNAWTKFAIANIVPALQGLGADVRVLYGADASSAIVRRAMRDFNPHMVDGVGHGNDQVFTGDQGREIYTQGDACCAELAGRAFVPVSCLVGNGLLPYMVDKGLGCGLGEITEYWFGTDPSEPPESDHMVGWFQWSEFAYKSEICVGHDATAAFANMSASYEAHAAAADSTDPDVADLLRYDLLNRKSFGSPAWVVGKIEPPPEPPTPPAPECWLCGILRTLMGWFGCRA